MIRIRNDADPGGRRITCRVLAQETQAGLAASLRPWQPVLQLRLPRTSSELRHANVNESKRKLLGARSLPLGCNAPMESFFGTLKTESLHHYRFATREQARQVIFEYIEVFYNRIRRHAKIGNQAPANFAHQFYASNPIAA